MKLKFINTALAAAMLALAGCQPDDYSLGSIPYTSSDLVEGIAYTITADEDNPNTIYLKSLLSSSYTALWEHPQGRSQGAEVTLNIPFEGTYDVVFGIITSGGIVYGDTAHFTIDTFCADFVSDDLWTYISGGVGESKRWYIDLDEYGESKYFSGPLYFYGTDDSWETVTDGVELDTDVYDSWYWQADWASVAGWQWVDYAMDFGYMEFDLNGGANVTTVCNDLGTTATGTYLLDTDNHTISFTDAPLLHDSMNDSQVASWTGEMRLFSLTEDYMQIGVLRIEDPCYLLFNFISQDYYDNWEEEVDANPTPTLADTWQTDILTLIQSYNTYQTVIWSFSDEDDAAAYCDLYGSTTSSATAATDDALEMTLQLCAGDMTYIMTDTNGDTAEGTFELTDDGFISFSNGLLTISDVDDNGTEFRTNSDNTLRVLSYTMEDDDGDGTEEMITNLWLGYDLYDIYGNRYAYQGFNLTPSAPGVETVSTFKCGLHYFDPDFAFQDSETLKIEEGTDGSYTLRVEGADSNPYGMYLDVIKVLKTYPNFDMTITDIRVDGTSIDFDDTLIDRCTGDETDSDGNYITARRYIINPWNTENYFVANDCVSNFIFSSSIEIDIDVEFDTGEPFISDDDEEEETTE